MGIGAIVSRVAGPLFGIIDKAVPDKDLREKLKAELQGSWLDILKTELQAQASIIIAEAQGESWIQRNWRPLTMLTFTSLIVARWLGFTAPGITPDLEGQLLDIIKVGLGGYVLGRSGEKIAKAWKGT